MRAARNKLKLPADEAQARRDAVDPHASAFVSANAGSGKTTILVERIIRLLLSGADPASILALTYTKAAAAEMQARVFDTLSEWASLSDAALESAIASLEGAPARLDLRLRARRLFASALETPGGLRIQTIHAFCEKLLHLFPFEANVPARFDVLDERQGNALFDQALQDVVSGSVANNTIATALDSLLADHAAGTVASWISTTAHSHGTSVAAIAAGLEQNGRDIPLRLALGLDATKSDIAIAKDLLAGQIPERDWPGLAEALAKGSANDQRSARAFKAAIAASNAPSKLERYFEIFLTGDGNKLRAERSLVTKSIDEPIRQRILSAAEAIPAALETWNAVCCARRSEAVIRLANAVRERFQRLKSLRGFLDFDDQIEKVATLFDRAEASWILYKLDGGINHVLVDEAQDTSPRQWQIIRKLTEDFFAGYGQRGDIQRTVFAVGDEKQSIYGFQGARPESFGENRVHFSKSAAGHSPFHALKLNLSFRTTRDVLTAVDSAFLDLAHYNGLSSDNVAPVHLSARETEPGFVEIWPPERSDEIISNDNALDPESEADKPVLAGYQKLAERIARHIQLWVKTPHRFENDGQPIQPGDIMILVRKRDALLESLLRALKRAGVPVAGADRLKLQEHIAILDLIGLADVMLDPDDDLALATLLKSPIFGLDDDDLIRLAAGRGTTRLESRLLAGNAADRAIIETIKRWRVLASKLDPFGFYATLLSVEGVRARLLSRLGPDSAEAMDVFLADLRSEEQRDAPSLAEFIERFRSTTRDVKRDLAASGNAVRVMTVHAAKGLEARLVILPDTFAVPGGGRQSPVFELRPASGDQPAIIAVNSRSAVAPEAVRAAQDAREARDLAEYRRLLYVAMTRTKDRLYVGGYMTARSKEEGQHWYHQLELSLRTSPFMTEAPADDGNGTVLRLRVNPASPVGPAKPEASPLTANEIEKRFDFLQDPLPPDPAPLPPLKPSSPLDAAERSKSRHEESAILLALRRGEAVHLLVERLGELDPEEKFEAGRRLLQQTVPDIEAGLRDRWIDMAMRLLENHDLAPFFASDALAEVPLAGDVVLPDGLRHSIRGRIDRMVRTRDAVLFVDFKTGRAPSSPPTAHKIQIALYGALLETIFPGANVRGALVYTTDASLHWQDVIERRAILEALPRTGLTGSFP